ncbi:YpiB family protein [Lacicoccus alkaliphilus]|uniref:Uncharacterized protein YpiB, UPF0302 family n=1 Tax=Lacicoccus alkaliphilus DSM 16010 TaxID=1123231 RepID=A0A1M7B9L2_9BACL|nr:YpiB family protein [Salinicoccus alkaliphilus]SHL51738.1 Uncharacterized protein YpiB, UPF0302 family [Salinicoccus alkaliphilus DSM 16010]
MRTANYKRDFLDYVLYHYDFRDRTAVWILNFIKAHPTITNFISFTDRSSDRRLRIAEETTGRPTLVFEKGQIITTDGEVIFHDINSNKASPLYIEFIFHDRNRRYEAVKEREKGDVGSHINSQIRNLEAEIDAALQNNDRSLFYELSDQLNKARSIER